MNSDTVFDFLRSGIAGVAFVSIIIIVKAFLNHMGNHMRHTDEVLSRLASSIDKLTGKIDGMGGK